MLILIAFAMHVREYLIYLQDITHITYQCSSIPETSTPPETSTIGKIQLSIGMMETDDIET